MLLALSLIAAVAASPCGNISPIATDLALVARAPVHPTGEHLAAVRAAEALLAEGKHEEAMDAAHAAAEALRGDQSVPSRLVGRLTKRLGDLWNQAKTGVPEAATPKAVEPTSKSGGALDTPKLNQHSAGSYPGGYCATTSLRMVLRQEGLSDPGADTVALSGARPYIPGAGSDPTKLARRAQELGLTGATFKNNGQLADIKAMLDAGKPVMLGGEGTFRGTFEDGGAYSHTYRSSGHWMTAVGYEADAADNITSVTLNDPDTGRRVTSSTSQFLDFYAPDGNIWMVTY